MIGSTYILHLFLMQIYEKIGTMYHLVLFLCKKSCLSSIEKATLDNSTPNLNPS